jgi:hypothetical protein
VILVASALGVSSVVGAGDGTPRLPRVRSEDPALAAVIREATERSATFRRMIQTIDATDGLVYVEEGKCRHSVRACLLMFVRVAGPYRMLRIYVDTRKLAGNELMAAIGHELWHASETLSDRSVIDNKSILQFFHRIAPTGSERFETEEAMRTGLSVLEELNRDARSRKSCS